MAQACLSEDISPMYALPSSLSWYITKPYFSGFLIWMTIYWSLITETFTQYIEYLPGISARCFLSGAESFHLLPSHAHPVLHVGCEFDRYVSGRISYHEYSHTYYRVLSSFLVLYEARLCQDAVFYCHLRLYCPPGNFTGACLDTHKKRLDLSRLRSPVIHCFYRFC